MKKIKLLYVISTLKKCGPVNVLYNIIKYLDANLFDIYILTLSPNNLPDYKNKFISLGVKIINLDKSRFSVFTYNNIDFRNVIKEISPDIIHSHCFRSTVLISMISNYFQTYTTIHNYPNKDYRLNYGGIIGSLMCEIYLRAIKKIRYPVACSQSINNELKEKFKIETEVVVNGIDFNRIQKLNKSNIKKHEKKIIISVGSLDKRKNPLFIMEQYYKSQTANHCLLYFLGDGELRENCKKKCNDNILLFGNVENVMDYLAIADVYISASKAEGMPNSVLEAMACGLPVFLSDIEPHKEILKYDERAGKLFSLENSGLSNLFNNIETLNLMEMSNAGKNVIQNYLSASKMAIKYQTMYLRKNRRK